MKAELDPALARSRFRRCSLAVRRAGLALCLGFLACQPEENAAPPPSTTPEDGVVRVARDLYPRCSIELTPKHELLGALREGRTRELTAYFEKLHQRYGSEVNCDYVMVIAFDWLTPSEPWVTASVDTWVEREPDSWIAATARGYHYNSLAWKSRGTRAFRDTTEEGRRGMREAGAVSAAELERAIELEPKALPAYAQLLLTARLIAPAEVKQKLYERAASAHPLSFQVHKNRMHTLAPKWGGSYLEMQELAASLDEAAKENPELSILHAYPIREMAMQARRGRDFEEALQLFDRAFLHGSRNTWLIDAARTAYALKLYSRGLTYLEFAEERWGPWEDTLYWRTRLLMELRRFDEALKTAQRAAALFPLDDRPPTQTGWAYRWLERWPESAAAYAVALEMDPDDRSILAHYAWTLAAKLDRADEAVALYEARLEDEPDDPELVYGLGDLYADLGDPRGVPLLERYLGMIEGETSKERERIQWITRYLAQRSAPGPGG